MEPLDSTLLREFWYYYLVYYFVYWLVALLLARFVLSLFVQPDSLNVVWRVLVIVTDPPWGEHEDLGRPSSSPTRQCG